MASFITCAIKDRLRIFGKTYNFSHKWRARRRGSFPHPLGAESRKCIVGADDRDVLNNGLSGEHAVEGVPVVPRELLEEALGDRFRVVPRNAPGETPGDKPGVGLTRPDHSQLNCDTGIW